MSASLTTTVYVVSWEFWHGSERGGGGFEWYMALNTALAAFAVEKESWHDTPVSVRLTPIHVPVVVPETPYTDHTYVSPGIKDAITGIYYDAITEWIEHHSDLYEYAPGTGALPALRVAHVLAQRERV